MRNFFSRLARPSRAPGRLQAPSAQGQEQVHALLNPSGFGSDNVNNFIQAIHDADPQTQWLGIMRRRRRSPATASSVLRPRVSNNSTNILALSPAEDMWRTESQGNMGSSSSTRSVHQSESNSEPHIESHSSSSPPVSLLVEHFEYARSEVSDDAEPVRSYASSYNGPNSQISYEETQEWAFIRDSQAKIFIGSDQDDAVISDTEQMESHNRNVQGMFWSSSEPSGSQGAPIGPVESPSRSLSPGIGSSRAGLWPRPNNRGSRATQRRHKLNTSVLSFNTDETERFTSRVPGVESNHTSPGSSYHSKSSSDSDVSIEQAILDDLRDDEQEDGQMA